MAKPHRVDLLAYKRLNRLTVAPRQQADRAEPSGRSALAIGRALNLHCAAMQVLCGLPTAALQSPAQARSSPIICAGKPTRQHQAVRPLSSPARAAEKEVQPVRVSLLAELPGSGA